ncbi:mediator complex subunit [Malassezia vespertilionis]|uniref:mediator complex subunit n=1 Tax=Malassezia vespertilionis TaxID=2020962 RepID=UPI0024B0FEDA|nr:mediator complex subunit [Malassezia vespertilionis]WFD07961.1 mediator complex subunit [Malassezia vespertilionis]
MPEGVNEAELLQELPLEQTDLLPLGALVERFSNNAYQTLQSLADTDARKEKLFTTAMELRKQFVKLLVLIRWSRDAEQLNKARNIVALLADQQWAHEDVFSGLTQVRKILPNARVCDADLVTAIELLRTGTYDRLPASIKDSAVLPSRMTNREARLVLEGLDQVLAVRLAWTESVPRGIRLDSIEDGKAYLSVPDLYFMCITTSGPEKEDRWWLLEFEFAEMATDGDEDLSELLTKPYLDTVYPTAETILASQEEPQSAPALVRLHVFLEQKAMERRLHILYHQLQRMVRFRWSTNVRFTLQPQTNTLDIHYWVANAAPAGQKKALHQGMLSGTLRLRLHTEPCAGAELILAELITGNVEVPGKSGIQVTWEVDKALQDVLHAEHSSSQLKKLDIEKLLLDTIDLHSYALMKLFQEQIDRHPTLGANQSFLCLLRSHAKNGYGPRHSIELRVTDTVHVMLYISTITGRVGLKSLHNLESAENEDLALSLSETQNIALQRMAAKITANPSSLTETLVSFRLQSLTKDVSLQASWLGLAYMTSVSLRPGEFQKIGLDHGHPLLYLPLTMFPGYYALIYFVSGQAMTMALISIMTMTEAGKSVQVISSVKWLDRARMKSYSISGASLQVVVAYGFDGEKQLPYLVTVDFDVSGNGQTYGLEFEVQHGKDTPNPHKCIGANLERKLCSMADTRINLWSGFLHLLEYTLPMLLILVPFFQEAETNADSPQVEVLDINWYRFCFLNTYALDVRLLTGNRVMLTDAAYSAGATSEESNAENQSENIPFGLASPYARIPLLAQIWQQSFKTADCLKDSTNQAVFHVTLSDVEKNLPLFLNKINQSL